MIFAVSFSTRPLDYFLPPPAQRGGRLSATHDSATRGAGDTVPTEHIFSIIDLRLALSRIHEAAIARYPRPVAEVFAVVHAASLAEALDHAPQDPVHATINLYTYGFTKLFEAIPVDKIQSLSADSTAWPLPPSVSSRPIQLDCPQVPNQSSVSADHSHWGRCWAILMADYKRVEHLVQNNFVNHAYNESSLPDIAEPDTAAPYADTTARCESSPFDSNVSHECTVNGLKRCVPSGKFRTFQALAATHNISFPMDDVFLKPEVRRYQIPHAAVQVLSALVQLLSMSISKTLKIFRGQTRGDQRPNWTFQWVDGIVIIETDIGDRLLRAERRLRDAIKLVFGSDGWHEGGLGPDPNASMPSA
ncbi:hypothetical protein PC128_g17623 [Phytophthora cactorum]|nr:hypothetical protein PC128_g17623 [Phytophthora cactorum]